MYVAEIQQFVNAIIVESINQISNMSKNKSVRGYNC